ncbi:MAG: glycine cleavage system protein T [Candidatus Omnitrophica bacterium CG11_big_fil_rev_8_21_14_0_20_45_26]|uniref:Aminomethyltransferase n=1 Tax=Candidatus Abzuiibacterium crystallinum TaxID=1974748 RepID=A0A2H0LPD0_9BACT|nr:MAG: glycine cleavage system protein T [Candidatus Omnitrophica bacterium CG11_big_fil_rev_8_21_14_0_20_45_26]PIW64315.1 MAG: glycine cleavage system protein T [Candidatus Omnitrophica bacterium CG12_big_fil_rev_8_21_14_0_65_45_16]
MPPYYFETAMTTDSMTAHKQLPVHTEHLALGAKMGIFGDWEVPLYYRSVIEEHDWVRTGVGVFDISHMGEFFVRGKSAEIFLNQIVTNQVSRLEDGKALYTPVCRPDGGIVDDVIVYRLKADSFLVIVNAANVEKDFEWFVKNNQTDTVVSNETDRFALFAVQGPRSTAVTERLLEQTVSEMPYYSIRQAAHWKTGYVARTGYTGEIGYEILCPAEQATKIWRALMAAGKTEGIQPIGFGARDTLRLEAGMLLYGQDMTDETTPLEVGLERTVFFEKDFIGKHALLNQKKSGVKKKLAAFELLERGIPRHGYDVYVNGQKTGVVTSGSYSPTLKKNIGLALLEQPHVQAGEIIDIQIRQSQVKAKVVNFPFYKRQKKEKG